MHSFQKAVRKREDIIRLNLDTLLESWDGSK